MPIEATGYTMKQLLVDLREMPAQVRRGLKPALVRVCTPMVSDAKRNAGWSRRIPAAIKLSLTAKGVSIVVRVAKAPHARAYEGMAAGPKYYVGPPGHRSARNRPAYGNTFRHPLFGDTDVWVDQERRPFLMPAVRAHWHDVEPAIRKVVEDAARSHGARVT